MMEEYVTINALTMSSSAETIYSNSKGAIVKTILLHPTNSDVKKATLLFDGVAFDFELLNGTTIINTPILAKSIKGSGQGVNIHITGLQL